MTRDSRRTPALYIALSLSLTFVLIIGALPAKASDHALLVGQTWGSSVVSANDRFLVLTTRGHSYSCTAYSQASPSSFKFSLEIHGLDGDPTSKQFTGWDDPQIPGRIKEQRISYTSGCCGEFLTVAETNPGGENVTVKCVDTTLVGEFNTNGTMYNFLELVSNNTYQNPLPNGYTAVVTALDNQGNVLVNSRKVKVNDASRVDIALHDLVGTNMFGTIYISHDGAEQSLRGSVSRYAPGTSAHEPLILRQSTPLRRLAD